MKKVYVLRHAAWKYPEGTLTPEGEKKIAGLKKTAKMFNIIISSPATRAQQTAKLLTNKDPIIENRASILDVTEEELNYIVTQGKNHPFGMAGFIFDDPKFIKLAEKKGKELADLILETLGKLKDGESALILSHDGVMVAAEKVLKQQPFEPIDYSYKLLEGFTVDENLHIEKFHSNNN